MNLAVADIVYSTFTIPPIIVSHNVSHPEGVTGRVLCALLTGKNVAWIGSYASVFTLIAIAIERYFAVVYPYGSKGKLTMRKLKVCYFGTRNKCLAEPREARGRVHRGSKLWSHLDLCMRLFAVPLRLL